jgi:hypothetical protein
MIMYSAVLPSYHSKEKDEKGEVIRADDPQNNDKVRKLLFG